MRESYLGKGGPLLLYPMALWPGGGGGVRPPRPPSVYGPEFMRALQTFVNIPQLTSQEA